MAIKREVIEVGKNRWCIRDFNLDNYYLVAAGERNFLIDCGSGIGNPLKEVEEKSKAPVTLLVTHGHMDHCGNADYFSDIYMSPLDDDLLNTHYGDPDMIRWYIETRGPVRYPGEGHVEEMKALVPDEKKPRFSYKPIHEGDTWTSGDVTLEAIPTPGHTPGSISFLDRGARLLFSGDALNEGIIIINKPEGTRPEIKVMRDSLRNLLRYYDAFDAICMGHDGPLKDKSIIKDYLFLCEGLLDGSIKGEYEEQVIRAGRVVRHGLAELWYEADR